MRTVGIHGADLKSCIQDAQQESIVITRNGKPVALLIGVEGLDLEQIELGRSDKFWTLIRQRRGQKTLSRAELEKRIADGEQVARPAPSPRRVCRTDPTKRAK